MQHYNNQTLVGQTNNNNDSDKEINTEDSARRKGSYTVASGGEAVSKQEKIPCLPQENAVEENKHN